MSERDDERVVVGRLDADLGEIGDLAGAVGFAVDEVVELVGVFGRGGRVQRALPGIEEVVRGERLAVAPFRVGAES